MLAICSSYNGCVTTPNNLLFTHWTRYLSTNFTLNSYTRKYDLTKRMCTTTYRYIEEYTLSRLEVIITRKISQAMDNNALHNGLNVSGAR